MTLFCTHFFAPYYTVALVIAGTTILGITCGLLGTFSLLKGYSLLGDAVSHAALPGVACAFLLTQTKNPVFLMIGGATTGFITMLILFVAQRWTRLKLDTLLGILLSVFFGLGLVCMTLIQKLPLPNQAVLNKFIFGNAATLLPQDIVCMLFVSGLIIISLCCIWKELTLVTFDPIFARSVGYPLVKLDGILSCLLLALIAVGLQTVGVILMSALLIAPAAAARQWTTQIHSMALIAAGIGGGSCMGGTLLSYFIEHVSTGPLIVILVSFVAFISLYTTPSRRYL